ncbi:MAG: ComF family protein [Deltaproteobacteria bacterium]
MLDLIFPKICCSCEKPLTGESALCGPCSGEIKFINELSSCALCGGPFGFFSSEESDNFLFAPGAGDEGHLCGNCIRGKFSFKRARSVAVYEGRLRDMIHEFKYEGRLSLEGVLSRLLFDNSPCDPGEFDMVVPVPLHVNKLRQREYNQSAVMAMNLASRAGIRLNLLSLRKTRDTRPQFELKNEEERRRNVRGAFKVKSGETLRGASILLVDDVFTTGSTSEECTRELLKSGASEVSVITLARAKGV